jgi:hypothetical protein
MFQGQCLYRQRTVIIDNLLDGRIDSLELHFIIQIATEEINLSLQDVSKFLGSIDRQLGSTSQQAKGTQHTNESETMVTMQMGDENGTDLGKTKARTAQLYLCSLTAIHEEQLATHLYDLS